MKVGIIGANGLVAQRHKAAWNKLGIKWEPIDTWDSYDIDLYDICTPIYLHAHMIRQAVLSGKLVLCEKPLALNMDEGMRLVEDLKNYDARVGIIYQFRFNPKILQLKKELEEGKYGEIKLVTVTYFRWKTGEYFKGWRASQTEAGGGVVLNVTIHYLDLMQWLFGFPTNIHGNITTMTPGIDVEDTCTATMRFPNGAVGSYVVSSHVDPQYHMEMGVYGTKGHTRIELKENEYHAENFQSFLDGKDYVTPTEALKSLKMVERIYAQD